MKQSLLAIKIGPLLYSKEKIIIFVEMIKETITIFSVIIQTLILTSQFNTTF